MTFCVRLMVFAWALLLAGAANPQVITSFDGPGLFPKKGPAYSPQDLSPDLPACKRNDAAWWAQVLRFEKMRTDPRLLSDITWRVDRWHDTLPHVNDWPLEFRRRPPQTPQGAAPQFGPAQGVTWLDIDGDGWCDALLSVEPEAAKRPGLPILLIRLSAALFFDPASKTFKLGHRGKYFFHYRSGEITSTFTFYYNRKARRVETVERVFSGGMSYSSEGWEELHGQLMLKGTLVYESLCKREQPAAESEPCVARDSTYAEFDYVLHELSKFGPRQAAIRERLLDLADAPAKGQ